MIRNLAILTLLVSSNVFFSTCVLASDSSKLNVDVNVAGNDEQIVEKETLDPNQSIIDEGSERLAQVNEMRSEIRALKIQIERAKGENKFALEFELQEKVVSTMDQLFGLAGVLERQNEAGIDTENLRDEVVSLVITASNAADQAIDTAIDAFSRGRSTSAEFAGFDRIEFEQSSVDQLEWIKMLFKTKGKTILEIDRLGLKTENHKTNFVNRLVPFADTLSGQIRLISKEKSAIETTASGQPLSPELDLQLRALRTRELGTLNTLSAIVILMDKADLDTTRYRQLLLQTGEVSTDLFNPRIVLGILKSELIKMAGHARDNVGAYVTRTIIFLLILLAFKLIANLVSYLILKSFESKRVETSRLMQEMLLALSSKGIMLLGFLVALGQLGVEITALLTGLGIAGFIVGFALQDTLANFAAGIMILGYRPFDVDDIIEAGGVIGKVSKMSLVSTTILTFDNQTLILPNNKIWGDVIKNITLQKNRRIDMEFRVDYSEDIEQVKQLILQVIDGHEKILDDPAATVEMDQMTPSALIFVVRPWVERANYWSVKWELLRTIKEKLDKQGIKIPVARAGIEIS
jgi:small conductance mechanosensitive channel|tara:strand:- start:1799 stop:3532 length:1734 start_codon:yes stop_codon:yes gene_type:complete